MASVTFPLLAVEVGYSASEVGILVALSAVAQIAARVGMGAWMSRIPDWSFILVAGALLCLSCALPLLSTAWGPFIVAHLLQGVARAFFWTGSQTHVVRGERGAIKELASVNLIASSGLTIGPLAAGALALHSMSIALVVAALTAFLACIPAVCLDRLPVFARSKKVAGGGVWRRPGVIAACWAGVSAGAWRALLNSFVPLVLLYADQSPATIGVVVGIGNFAQIVGSWIIARLPRRALVVGFAGSVLCAGVGIAAVAGLAHSAVWASAALAISGIGAGALQTLGPAIASDSVDPQELGQAIAAVGVFRAGALFAAPLGASAIAMVAPLWVTLVLGGILIAAPVHLAKHAGVSEE